MKQARLLFDLKFFVVFLVCFLFVAHAPLQCVDTDDWREELPLAKRVATFGKVWGILKYFHPGVASGDIDWDQALIDALPCVKAAADFVSFNQELDNLIIQAGDVDKATYNPNASAHPNEELFKWLKRDPILSDTVREKLILVHTKFNPVESYQMSYNEGGKVSFPNELDTWPPYFPDEGERIVALFRFWNILNYFNPYRGLIDENWDDVLEEFVEPFLNAQDGFEWAWPLAELAVRVDDTHCYVGNAFQYMNLGYFYAPVETVYVEGKTVINRVWPELMQPPGALQLGDVILETKGQDIDTFRASMMKYAHGSNDAVKNRQINDYVVRDKPITMHFKIERDGQIMDVTMQGVDYYHIYWKKKYEDATQEMWKILPGNIGYVNMVMLKKEDVPVVMPQLMNTEAIIFDVRQRPNGTHYLLADWLNKAPKKFSRFKRPVVNVPGAWYMETYFKVGRKNPDYYRGKVILLVNEWTQSHGEFACMALQTAPDVTVVGSTTAGTDGDYIMVFLPGGNSFTFTGLGVYYPNGHPTQQVGIVPDIFVRPTVEGIRRGRDEVLEKAIEFVESSK